MKASFNSCSLYLCPEQHDLSVKDKAALISDLREIKFIAASFTVAGAEAKETGSNFYSGEKFLDYIAYMGCSPAIQFEPGNLEDSKHEGGSFCHIRIHLFKTAELIYNQGPQAKAPLCPACKKPVTDWQPARSGSQILCPSCGCAASIEDYNWRKNAGFARLFIEITDIFPKEALPQQILLDRLRDITGTGWQYFYRCRQH